MIKKVYNKKFLNVLWRFSGGNIILLCIGIFLMFKYTNAVDVFITNTVITAVFATNCYKRVNGKMIFKPSTIYFLTLMIFCVISSMFFTSLTELSYDILINFLQYAVCLIWVFNFASPELDVIEK